MGAGVGGRFVEADAARSVPATSLRNLTPSSTKTAVAGVDRGRSGEVEDRVVWGDRGGSRRFRAGSGGVDRGDLEGVGGAVREGADARRRRRRARSRRRLRGRADVGGDPVAGDRAAAAARRRGSSLAALRALGDRDHPRRCSRRRSAGETVKLRVAGGARVPGRIGRAHAEGVGAVGQRGRGGVGGAGARAGAEARGTGVDRAGKGRAGLESSGIRRSGSSRWSCPSGRRRSWSSAAWCRSAIRRRPARRRCCRPGRLPSLRSGGPPSARPL